MKSVYELVMDNLLAVLEEDNGGPFEATPDDYREAEEPIHDLIKAGYFLEPAPDDLEASFWQAAAGEETEAKEFFSRAPEAYEKLSAILTRIFDGVSA